MKEYVICIDESGSFRPDDNRTSFIAGFVYECDPEREVIDSWSSEKIRMNQRFKNRCAYKHELRLLEYPKCLHTTKLLIAQREALREMLTAYIRERNAAANTCQYSPILITRHNMNTVVSGNELVDDMLYANLYNNMLERLLNAVLLHPRLEVPCKVTLEIPTRQHVIERHGLEDETKLAELELLCEKMKKQGYSFTTEPANGTTNWTKKYFSIVNTAAIKKAIEGAIKHRPGINIELNSLEPVRLNYEGDPRDQIGIMAADILCDEVKDSVYPAFEDDMADYHAIRAHFAQAYGSQNCVLLDYTEAFDMWQDALRCAYSGDALGLIRAMARVVRSTSREAEYMINACFPLLDCLYEHAEAFLPGSGDQVYEYLKGEFHEANYRVVTIVGEWYYQKAKQKGTITGGSQPHTQFCVLLLSSYQHMGDIRSKIYREGTKRMEPYLAYTAQMQLRNKAISDYENMFDFDRSLPEADKLVDEYRAFFEVAQELRPDERRYDMDYARSVGKLAQSFAFQNRYISARRYCDESIKLIPITDEANLDISRSYALHAAIERKPKLSIGPDWEMYRKYGAPYFGVPGLIHATDMLFEEQFDALLSGKRKNDRFGLFVLIKAMYMFGLDDERIINRVITQDYTDFLTTLHPFELIHKYIALFAHQVGNEEIVRSAIEALKKMYKNNENGITIRLIIQSGLMQIGLQTENEALCQEAYDEINRLIEATPELSESIRKVTGATPEVILEQFTYMYR